MTATYQHGVYGPRPLDTDEAIRLLRKVTSAYSEVLEQLYEYDSENDVWSTCSEHPEGSCGYRDMPSFFITACVTQCDIQDAQRFLEAWDQQ